MTDTAVHPAATVGMARVSDPETSHIAAAAERDLRASQREVLQLFKRFGAMDDRAMVDAARYVGDIKQSESGLRSRRAELVDRGLVRDTGRKNLENPKFPRTIWTATSP